MGSTAQTCTLRQIRVIRLSMLVVRDPGASSHDPESAAGRRIQSRPAGRKERNILSDLREAEGGIATILDKPCTIDGSNESVEQEAFVSFVTAQSPECRPQLILNISHTVRKLSLALD